MSDLETIIKNNIDIKLAMLIKQKINIAIDIQVWNQIYYQWILFSIQDQIVKEIKHRKYCAICRPLLLPRISNFD